MGAGGVKNFSVGICDGAPSTAHSSYPFKRLKLKTLASDSVMKQDNVKTLLFYYVKLYMS